MYICKIKWLGISNHMWLNKIIEFFCSLLWQAKLSCDKPSCLATSLAVLQQAKLSCDKPCCRVTSWLAVMQQAKLSFNSLSCFAQAQLSCDKPSCRATSHLSCYHWNTM
jgi:hypothetical protein